MASNSTLWQWLTALGARGAVVNAGRTIEARQRIEAQVDAVAQRIAERDPAVAA